MKRRRAMPTRKKKTRVKKVFPNYQMSSAFLGDEFKEGWTRSRDQSFEGRNYYALVGAPRVKVATKFEGYVLAHPVIQMIACGPKFAQKWRYLHKHSGCTRNASIRYGSNRCDLAQCLFMAPRPPSSRTHDENIGYLASRLEHAVRAVRGHYTDSYYSKYRIRARCERFDEARAELADYCYAFEQPTPVVKGVDEFIQRMNSRQALMKAKYGGDFEMMKY